MTAAAKKKVTAKAGTKKKVTAAKSIKKKKPSAMRKGSKYQCGVCGVAVSIDEVCGCVDTCDIICCGEQMKPKKK